VVNVIVGRIQPQHTSNPLFLRGQPANPGSPGKVAVKMMCLSALLYDGIAAITDGGTSVVELGTFLCNNEMERHRLKVKSLTVSLW